MKIGHILVGMVLLMTGSGRAVAAGTDGMGGRKVPFGMLTDRCETKGGYVLPKRLGEGMRKNPFAQSVEGMLLEARGGERRRAARLVGGGNSTFEGYVATNTADETTEGMMAEITQRGRVDVMGSAKYVPESGAAVIDGTYYALVYDDTYQEFFGETYYYIAAYDAETMAYDETKTVTLSYEDYRNYALAMTTDKSGRLLFAETFNKGMTGLQFVTYDPAAKDGSRRVVGTPTQQYLCMARAKDGVVYGVTVDGDLYAIDTETGRETLVGNTGRATVQDDECYAQSMAYDEKWGRMYWFEVDGSGASSGLYEVDLATGQTTLVYGDEELLQIYGAVVAKPKAEDDAPAEVADLTMHFEGGATTGRIAFAAPTETYAGEALTGELTYEVKANGTVVGTGQCTAGERVTCEVTCPEGETEIAVTTSNEAGVSPQATGHAYVGYDEPCSPTDVRLTIDDEGNVELTWTAPTEGVKGGYIGELTYGIVCATGGSRDTIATGVGETTYRTRIEIGEKKKHVYGVYAKGKRQTSGTALSSGVVMGEALEAPVAWGDAEAGLTEDEFALFDVVDDNEDGSTWAYTEDGVCYTFSEANEGDDWLFTPTWKVKKGTTYRVRYVAETSIASYPETMEVWTATGAGVGSLVKCVVAAYQPPTQSEVKEVMVTAQEAGELCVGFHAVSQPNMYRLKLLMVSVEKESNLMAPAAVTDLVVTPAARGEKKAHVSFTTPTKNLRGGQISELTRVDVTRNGQLLKRYEQPAVGTQLELDDEVEENGVYMYGVTAWNEYDDGRTATDTVYVGLDAPANIYATLRDGKTSVSLSWEKVGDRGQHGGYVNPEEVSYEIYSIRDGYIEALVGTTKETSYTIDGKATDEGQMDLLMYATRAVNEAGGSYYVGTNSIVVGCPVGLPLTETFTDGGVDQYWWLSSRGRGEWSTSVSDDATGGRGCAVYSGGAAGDMAWLSTGKVTLASAVAPALSFAAKMDEGAELAIDVRRRDGMSMTVATYAGSSETKAWTSYTVPLPEAVKNEDFVIVSFRATSTTDGARVKLDNVKVSNLVERDLAVVMSVPETTDRGDTAHVVVNVTNNAMTAATRYVVTLGDDERTGENLGAFETATYRYDVPVSIFEEAQTLTLTARVTSEGDQNEGNNTARGSIKLTDADVEPLDELMATAKGGDVELTWEAKEGGYRTEEEGFETYDNMTAFPYTKNTTQTSTLEEWNTEGTLGPWTAYDLDGGAAYGWYDESIVWPYEGDAFGFVVYNGKAMFTEAAEAMTHTGDQALLCMDFLPTTGGAQHNDDWLVSPRLSGRGQTVRFWVNELNAEYGHETFEVLYSTTDKAPEAFVKLMDGQANEAMGWQEIRCELPEGAQYFAIRVTSADVFGMMVDDITYETYEEAPVGFRVYKNKVLAAETSARSYTDADGMKDKATYDVTAVYAGGKESRPRTVVCDGETGIEHVAKTDGEADVYTLGGVKMRKAVRRGVYVVNSKLRISGS